MKKMLVIFSCFIFTTFAACNLNKLDVSDLNKIQKKYIDPLGLTRVVGMAWSTPSDIDPSGVLIAYMIKIYEDPVVSAKYYVNYEYVFPQEEVEAYSKQYFGMSPEDTRKAEYYNNETSSYVVPEGLGGAWSIKVTGAEQDSDKLYIKYNYLDGQDEVGACGIMTIKINSDGSYQYLSNEREELILPE